MWFPRNEVPGNAALQPIAFMSKSPTSSKMHYSNIERETLGILHDLENFQHYCCTLEVSTVTDYKPLVAIFKKDVANLSHRLQLQRILLHVHQYSIGILYKPEPQPFIAHWLSRHNHETNRDEEIPGMSEATRMHDSGRNKVGNNR